MQAGGSGLGPVGGREHITGILEQGDRFRGCSHDFFRTEGGLEIRRETCFPLPGKPALEWGKGSSLLERSDRVQFLICQRSWAHQFH